jgi:hypothetical protein
MQATINLLRPFRQQREILNSSARFKVLAIGRQWGKSELALIDSVQRLLRGENQWYCSPTNKNTRRMYPKFKAALKGIPGIYTNDTEFFIRLPNGVFIQFVSLHDADNLRGEGLHHMKIDEAAFIKHGVWDKVLRPMLAARQGSAWLLSSPNGRNEFWTWYQYGKNPDYPEWESFHAPSGSSPVLQDTEIQDIQRNTPKRVFEQEYMAEFLEDGGAVFRNITTCIDYNIIIDREKQDYPTPRGRVVMGADLGRVNDYTVIYAMDVATHTVIDYDRFTDIGWDIQASRISAMAKRWNPQTIVIEENFNDSFVERLRDHENLPVQAFRSTAQSKQQLINALVMAFEQIDIRIPNEPILIGELQQYSMERLPGGSLRYSAPSGLHDDAVMALALAWFAIANQGIATRLEIPDIYGR